MAQVHTPPHKHVSRAAAVLAEAALPGEEVVALLQRDPLAELQALLEQLEPQGSGAACSAF